MTPIRIPRYAAPLAFAVVLSGCASTEPGEYEGLRQGQINECNQMPSAQRARCMARITGEYEEHRRQQEMSKDE